MHIVWINNLSSFVGGCESYIFNTAALLKDCGVKSTLLYDPLEKSDPKFLQNFDMAFPIVDLTHQLKEIAPDLIYLHQLYNEKDLEILAGGNIPVVRFFHDHYNFCLRGHKLPLFSNKICQNVKSCRCHPLSFSIVRGNNLFGIKIKTLKHFKYLQSLNRSFSGFVVASGFMEKELIENGFASYKVCKIPLFAKEKEPHKLPRDKNLIVFAGQLVRGKGVDTLIKAASFLPECVKIVIIGEGRQKEKYRQMAKNFPQIEFLGPLAQDELMKWFERANCLVFPNRWPEPFGLVGPEAFQFGTPVIASLVGGVDEWFKEGKNGLEIPPDDPEALAAAIKKLRGNPYLYKTLSDNAIKIYNQKCTPEHHIIKLLSFLKRNSNRRRYTVKGGDEVETLVKDILYDVTEAVDKNIDPKQCHALLLMGGYGKGEGGVLLIDGKERLHNNIDFLLVSKNRNTKKLHKSLESIFSKISEKYSIGIDFSVISDKKLKRSPPLMIWHDLYYGHETLLGDPDYIKNLPLNNPDDIPESAVLELIRNRLSLLVINEWLLDNNSILNDHLKKAFIRHVMKAIIGLGDALLYFLGRYHFSYVEKLKRIKTHPDIPENLKKLYEKAANFRFQPSYDEYMSVDLLQWQNEIKKQLQQIHLKCETIRLKNPNLSWDNYLDENLNNLSLRPTKQKLKGLINLPKTFLGNNLKQKLAFLLYSPKERLNLILPLALYDIAAPSINKAEIKDAYLKQWQKYGDINFCRFMEKIKHG